MNERDLTYEDLLQIIRIIDSSASCTHFHLKYGDIQIEIEKRDTASEGIQNRFDASAVSAQKMAEIAAASVQITESPAPAVQIMESPAAADSSESEAAIPSLPADGFNVKAPMVGLFYRSPEPGAPPFVEVGQPVQKEDTVCLIEVMKLFTSIKAGCAGIVTHILAEDGFPVEYGQTLLVIDPKVDKG